MSARGTKRDLTSGPLFFKITLFALPIMLTGFLQIAYNMADNIIVGRFSHDPNALAAVGCTGSLNSLIINVLMGIAAGTGVVVSQYFGAANRDGVSSTVHTAMTFSALSGIVFGAIGLLVSRPALILLGTKPEILDSAVLYFRIICIGIPANTVYNFGAAILRGTGNSRVPLVILGSAGIINVCLNLLFVIGFGMAVEGVAIATVTAQYLSAIAVVTVLAARRGESFCLSLRNLGIKGEYLKRILRQGIPSGVQSSTYAIANVFMTGAVNTFTTATVTANSIASNIDAITLTSLTCFGQASMTFSGQNFGAKKPDRVKKTVIYCIIQAVIAGVLVSSLELLFADPLISLYISDDAQNRAEITAATLTIIRVMLPTYVIFGLLDVPSGGLKGLGRSITAMMINIVCICGVRILWILAIFPMIGTLTGLFLTYPVSWTVAFTVALPMFIVSYRAFKRDCSTPLSDNADALSEKSI